MTQLCAFTDAHLSPHSRCPEQCLVLTAAPVLRFVWSLLSTCSKLCQGPPREEDIRSQATFKSGWPVLTPLTMKPNGTRAGALTETGRCWHWVGRRQAGHQREDFREEEIQGLQDEREFFGWRQQDRGHSKAPVLRV